MFDTAELHGGYAYFHDPVPLSGMLAASYGSFHAGDRTAHSMTAWMMLRHLLARPGTDPKQRFRTLVGAVAAATTARQQAAAIEASFGVSVEELQREILALHSAVYHGVGQPRSRQAVAVRFERSGDPATTVKPADRAEVKALCSALRAAAGR